MDSFQENNPPSQNSSNHAEKKQSNNNRSSNNGKRKQSNNNRSSNNGKKKQSNNNRSSNNEKKKQTTNGSSNNGKKKQTTNGSSISHCLNGNNLEFLVAVLLLTGKLRVDAVQLFRQATMIVSLTGKYITLGDVGNENVDNMLKFLNENGNMTVDDIIHALKKKMDK
ncbi:hypothetical protein [Brevibacillus reuszeri]|uniref:Uncharacterized protein n=1 Tax=Brevibacillus reuszeri TaxID=54915 RepID=A0A0K9YMB2_9BACL|nr:hypothetical protein [Brevibacillus reuszeri]KNB69335.1 hypothetical protein ADS79_25865 [Brevibacillus reuszeri]MED1860365.1 hypothetical protein [Brevibacillus reuszeri]